MKIYLADIFAEAKCILKSHPVSIYESGVYSCDSVLGALYSYPKWMSTHGTEYAEQCLLDFLKDFGLDVGSTEEFDEFDESGGDEVKQGARFLWLCWLELMAREEGAYIDTGNPRGGIQYEKN